MDESSQRPGYILPIIVISQFAGTSLWFAGNAILPDIQDAWNLPGSAIGWISSSVQLGFISGTFLFALFSVSDRFSSQKVFFYSALAGAITNSLLIIATPTLFSIISLRFITGFFVAGIYPVGMKIAASWFQKGLGKALGLLVGALVLGKAFPHIIRALQVDWSLIMLSISFLTICGGLLILLYVPEGPNTKSGRSFSFSDLITVFKNEKFRRASIGYFGHMWELYAFWTFIPLLLFEYTTLHELEINPSFYAFLIMGMGCAGCVIGGYWSLKLGSARVAFLMLAVSCLCCMISPFIFQFNFWIFITILMVWGFTVVADSPQFSTLNASTVDPALIGTGLTIVTSIGFLISVGSIELLNFSKEYINTKYIFLLLIPGPLIGLRSVSHLIKKS